MFRYTGTIRPDMRRGRLPTLDEVLEELEDARATIVECQPHRIRFRGGIYRAVTNWNVLYPFSDGVLTFDPDNYRIHFELSLIQFHVANLVVALMMLGFIAYPTMYIPTFIVVGLCVVYALNVAFVYLIGMPRFVRFVQWAGH